MNSPQFPAWAFFTKLMVRRVGTRLRIYLEIPTGYAPRAKRLQKWLALGRVEEGTVIVEGADLPEALARLSFPPAAARIMSEITSIKGTRGVTTPVTDVERKLVLVEQLKRVLKEAIPK